MKKINKKELEKSVSLAIEQAISDGKLAGAVALVSQSGKLVCEVRRGYKNLETREKLVPNTIFRLASLTKPITGIATLIAVQNGWFRLEDKLHTYFPSFKDMRIGKIENGKVVTDSKAKNELCIWHLLTHSSGILCGESGGLQLSSASQESFESIHSMTKFASDCFLSFEPGNAAAYSAYAAFDIIACLIEQKSGLSYPDFLNKYVFLPLGIKDITFFPTETQWHRMINMYDRAEGNKMVRVDMGRHTYEKFPLSYTSAGAPLVGTAEDYLTIAQMLCEGGKFKGVRIIDSHYFPLINTPYVAPNSPGMGEEDGWGLGVRVAVNNKILPQGAFGWSGAYGTHFWVDPQNEIAAVYMKNNRWFDSGGCGYTGKEFEKIVMDSLSK